MTMRDGGLTLILDVLAGARLQRDLAERAEADLARELQAIRRRVDQHLRASEAEED